MQIKHPFTHDHGSEFDSEVLNQVQENAYARITDTMRRVREELDPILHDNRPEVVAQIAAAVVNTEMLLMQNLTTQEGVMFLGKSNLYIAKSIQQLASIVKENRS